MVLPPLDLYSPFTLIDFLISKWSLGKIIFFISASPSGTDTLGGGRFPVGGALARWRLLLGCTPLYMSFPLVCSPHLGLGLPPPPCQIPSCAFLTAAWDFGILMWRNRKTQNVVSSFSSFVDSPVFAVPLPWMVGFAPPHVLGVNFPLHGLPSRKDPSFHTPCFLPGFLSGSP